MSFNDLGRCLEPFDRQEADAWAKAEFGICGLLTVSVLAAGHMTRTVHETIRIPLESQLAFAHTLRASQGLYRTVFAVPEGVLLYSG